MKLKVIPEDFIVEELIDLPLSAKGRYTLLRLDKRLWNTLDVIGFLARQFSVSRNKFFRAGLKDRYSSSTQYLSYDGTITKPVQEKNFTVIPLGRTQRPVSAAVLIGNRFTITLRKLSVRDTAVVQKNADEVLEHGLPNYFDDQRFGSARHRKGFFARALMRGHYKGALKLLICYPHKEDSPLVKRFKTCCEQHWGEWHLCIQRVPREFRGVMRYLSEHPRAIKAALRHIDPEYGNLYLLAYQSYLFNNMAGYLIEEYGVGKHTVPYLAGDLLFYRKLKNRRTVTHMRLPMITHDLSLRIPEGKLVRSVLAEEDIRLKDFSLGTMRFRGIRFKQHWRTVIVQPHDLRILAAESDDRYPGKQKLTLCFALPPGSYATLVVKRLMFDDRAVD
ncbi:MAG: tRNA pseudouridine(13) synthase TruD [candidate division WOR-3 bacterium]|nr:MAG: tRNA pseudouridine(13) synthase TruD [candidate division WOR-3 bacterium]